MKLFVPGRICLFGEHSDWAGGYRRMNPSLEMGYALISGTNQGIYAEVEPHPTSLILSAVTPSGEELGPIEIPMQPDILLEEAQRGAFWSYIAGVAYQAMTHYQVRGLVINNTRTNLPVKKGLSSSAAISVLTARAFNRIYNLNLTTRGEMELAYQGEITTPSRCGRMDQGAAFGNRPVLMTFDGDRLDTTEVPIKQEMYFVLVDLLADKNTMKILSQLNACYPTAEDPVAEGVHELLGPINRRITHEAIDALQAGDARRIGALMTEAQAHFDRYAIPACPDELTAPLLHKVLSYPAIQPHIWGGKGVGSQGDGSAQLIARSEADQQRVVEIIERELHMPCLKLNLSTEQTVRKAVIPAAGFGTRLFPASKATKKELFPIVDRDGITKPALLLIVEEAFNAGLEEVILIVQEDDKAAFESFFLDAVPPENFNKLPPHFQEYARRLIEMGQRVRYVVQYEQEGFGHAIYQAREAVGDEPFLIMLGDHIYRSASEKSCARQLIETYQQHGKSVLGLRLTPEEQVVHFGTATGNWIEPGRLLSITEFAEKPSRDYAQNRLRVSDIGDDHYLTVFGQYVIHPRIFDYLDDHIRHNFRERGEFQLTSALDQLRRDEGLIGLLVDGEGFDIGQPMNYLNTLRAFYDR